MTGLDYKNTPVEIREKVSFTPKNIEKAYERLKQDARVKEAIILSTCNRSEIYAVTKNTEDEKNYLKNFYPQFFNIEKKELEKYINFRTKEDVINHLFEVACGFQSLVFGEDQILGQVKNAYNKSLEYKSAGKFLNRLFIDSITTAKKIKTRTGISGNSVSVSSIGVKLIEQKLGTLSNKKVLIIGLGKMSRLTVKNILDRNVDAVFVTNKTKRKITDFIKEFPEVKEIDFKDRYEAMKGVDAVISCTSAPHFVVNKEKFIQYCQNKPLCILDLAVPRDVDPDIRELDCVELYKIDDLEKIAQENTEKRFALKKKGEEIIVNNVRKYISWIEESSLIDVIMSISGNSKEITGFSGSGIANLKKALK